MIGVIIVSHGKVASQTVDEARRIVGELENVETARTVPIHDPRSTYSPQGLILLRTQLYGLGRNLVGTISLQDERWRDQCPVWSIPRSEYGSVIRVEHGP